MPSCGKKTEETAAKKVVVGFSQIGSESDWSTANTLSVKGEAAKRGIDLRFADGQQKQENQIRALRSFIDQKVDAIAISPVVDTGWQAVLEEVKAAGIPVILSGREVKVTDPSLYVTFVGSDFVEEGRNAARWFIEHTQGDLKVFELEGTPGASCAIDRSKGFRETIVDHPRIKIIKSQDGDFTSAKGKAVIEAFLKTPAGKEFNALYAHNDNMALGAIQAIKAAGRKPGADIKIVSIDAVRGAFEAMIAGELNCTIECNPLLGPKLFDVVEAVLAVKKLNALATKHNLLRPGALEALGGEAFKKRLSVKEGVFDQSVAKELIGGRKY
ncbi:MAG: ABC transporter substrate-binding protein [Phycisphaerae bacterium]|jgi:simple sugar transport system substrate-binding protein|nr:ABC transporter substrate-binding protein [Phycisphaerae bacterium]